MVIAAAAPVAALATTITFEDLTPDPRGGYNSVTDLGYTFSSSIVGPPSYFIGLVSSGYLNETGGNYLVVSHPDTVTLTKQGGGAFNLQSIDAKGLAFDQYEIDDADTILVNGKPFSIDLNLRTLNVNLNNVTSVAFSFAEPGRLDTPRGFIMDNAQVSPVPLPSSLPLFSTALLGLVSLGVKSRGKITA